MAYRKAKSQTFETKKEATKWAKEEKARMGKGAKIKWETNRLPASHAKKWEAVIYRDV